MANKTIRLNKAARELNVGYARLATFLKEKGHEVDNGPNARITSEQYTLLEQAFADSKAEMHAAQEIELGGSRNSSGSGNKKVVIEPNNEEEKPDAKHGQEEELIIRDNSNLSTPPTTDSGKKEKKAESPEEKKKEEKADDGIEYASTSRTKGLKVVGKMELDKKGNPIRKKPEAKKEKPEEKPKEEIRPQTSKQEPAKSSSKEEEGKGEKQETTPKAEKTSQTLQPEAKKPEAEKVQPKAKKQEGQAQKPDPEKEQQKQDAKPELQAPKAEHKTQGAEESKPEKKTTAEQKSTIPADNSKTTPSNREKDTSEPKKKAAEVSSEKEKQDKVSEKEVTAAKKTKQPEGRQEQKPSSKQNKPAEQKEESPIKANDEASEGGESQDQESLIKGRAGKLQGLKVIGKIDLPSSRSKRGGKSNAEREKDRKKRKRVKKQKGTPITQEGKAKSPNTGDSQKSKRGSSRRAKGGKKEEASKKEVDQQLKKTLSQMSSKGGGKTNKSRYKREKRQAAEEMRERQVQQDQEDAQILKVTEFISTSELATLMDVDVNSIIMTSMNIGMFISINQRLDAEAITILADEFGYAVEFTSAEDEIDVMLEEEDKEEDLSKRAPIVTIMGHVDHGKTSLLDYVRKADVASGEAGGITQHIGAYDVNTSSGRRVVFLDTPGHEAFTAMRARGAKVTDIAIIVVAADDSVMPQTVEAINHAQVAGVPFIIAFNKVDKPTADVNKLKQQLANMNVLVDDWGGKIPSQEISAKTGQGVEDLLELVLFESDLLELRANPKKNAIGTVIEASLDKGRGYMTTILVEGGTLSVGDMMLAGSHYGRVKAMNDHRGQKLDKVGPATPVQVLGLNGAPQAGDKLNVMDSDREAKDIANKRGQILREQTIRATKRTTLSDLGRRIALGSFHQLNVIIKGDVDGSIEALSDSLQKLSTEEIEVNIIHKAVGPIAESDVLLATASDAIVIGFQVRPVVSAKRLAESESVEVRLYSVIYDAINDVRDAMEGMLSPDVEEIIVGNVEVRDVFKISKVGTVAGCYVTEGYIKRNSQIRVIRDGIVIYGGEKGGEINALKRFKDDVSEVKQGFECGISLKNYNDLKVGDVIEAFEERETKRTL